MQITLIRHGQIPGNIDKRYIGTTDQDLTELGVQQASALNCPEVAGINKVFASPYKRCIQTAKLAFPFLESIIVDDLREMDFGIFENKTADEMVDFKPYRDWVDSMCVNKIPEGESLAEFQKRVCDGFVGIVRKCSNSDNIALVVHGGTIMSIMGEFNDEGNQYFAYHVGNCEKIVCELIYQGENCNTSQSSNFVLHRISQGC